MVLSSSLKYAVVIGGSQMVVTGGPSLSCVSARWVGKNVGWGVLTMES